ncbi:hypothetical protein CRYUN_Cryun23aG0063400 [Craigia yunnanensis]
MCGFSSLPQIHWLTTTLFLFTPLASLPSQKSTPSSAQKFPIPFFLFCLKSRRDRDRERAQARGGNKGKSVKDDGLTPEQRRERDAKALQEKAAKKAAQAAAGGNNSGGGAGSKSKK